MTERKPPDLSLTSWIDRQINEAIQAVVRGGRAVDAARLADVDVPLEEFPG